LSRKLKPKPQFLSNRQQVPRRQRERKVLLFLWIIIPLLIALSLGLVGYWYYDSYVAVWHQPVAKVNGKVIDMDYYVKMLRYYSLGSDPAGVASFVLPQIEEDELVRQGAEKFGIEVTADEVDQQIRDIFSPTPIPTITPGEGNETPTPAPTQVEGTPTPQQDFDDTYKQWLDLFQLSDEGYSQIVETSLLRQGIADYFKETEVPREGEQVLLHSIVVESEEKALEVVARIEEGEDFADLAKELSVDEGSKENGGNLGWVPRDIYPELDEIAFGLEPEVVSEPIPVGQNYYLIKVVGKAQDRAIDDEYRDILKSAKFQEWLEAEKEAGAIEEYLDQDKIDWAVNQVVG